MTLAHTIHFEGSQGNADLDSLFDGSVTYSCIQPALAQKLGMLHPLPKPREIKTSGESFLSEHAVLLDFYLNDFRLNDEFMLVSNLTQQVIIGELTMRKWKIKLNFETGEITPDPRAGKIILR
ncbi:MAG: hypothetical protein ACRD82_20845 [Blastocatellia bacterium]